MNMNMNRYNAELKIIDLFKPRSDGKCWRCQTSLVGKQRKWCKECCSVVLQEVMIAKGSSTYIRKALLMRDKGICINCGLDCELLGRVQTYARKSSWHWRTDPGFLVDNFKENELIFKPLIGHHGSYWEADHIIEVCNNGSHLLSNLQTLCISCHKDKTRKMHHPKKIKKSSTTAFA